MDKLAELKKLEAEMVANTSLPLRESNLVFGEGNVDCQVMFIGEAPGVNEDRLRRPFVGRGGQLLDDMIRGLGWKREDVYITNIVKRRPPENRDPLPAEIEAYKPYLTRQIEVIDPKLIVTLGRFSMNYFLPEAKITRDHGRPLMIDGRTIFPVYHPAAALRSTQMMEVLRGDFKKIPSVLSGEFGVAELPPAFGESSSTRTSKKPHPEKPKQAGLF
ncbi:MAG TPA: uracil-DNA glycosylase [Candidatus Paceibacterota bacterium]|nr:uracil-DNA glycosylase [Candidatus Paceibacterota bacterium]